MKKRIAILAATIVSATAFLGGCFVTQGTDGKDGKDGQNASAYEFYELAKTVHGDDYTIEQFLHDYLNYTPEELENAFNMQASINRSLMSAVSVAAQFTVKSYGQSRAMTSLGSGVIVELDKDKGDAYVLTNCHVVYDDASTEIFSNEIYLYLYGQDEDYTDEDNRFSATVIGASITYDVALLKVTGSELLKNSNARAAEIAAEDDVYVGESVYAVGNAEGCGLSATAGIITKDRETIALNLSDKYADNDSYVRSYSTVRTDAAVNEGNSGGALFNGEGKIVALINSKSTDEEDENGFMVDDVDAMNSAIPASVLRRLFPLMKDSYASKGFNAHDAKLSRAHFVALDDFYYLEQSSLSTAQKIEVMSSSAAASWDAENNRAIVNEKVSVTKDCYGLKHGDLITHIKISDTSGKAVENRDVTRMYHLQDTLLSAREGYEIVITVKRGGTETEIITPIAFSEFD